MRGRCDGRVIELALVLALLLPVSPVWAEEDASDAPFGALSARSQDGPITIKSDSLELDYRGSTLTYLGNVHVTQGDMVLTSDRLAIAFQKGVLEGTAPAREKTETGGRARDRIREIVADGNVRIEQEQRVATGKRAVFDHAKQTIVLSDNAVLEEGPNQVSGERIVVYLSEQRSVIESGAKARVQAVLYPGTVDDDALAAAETPPVAEVDAEAAAEGNDGAAGPSHPSHDALADSGARAPSDAGDGAP